MTLKTTRRILRTPKKRQAGYLKWKVLATLLYNTYPWIDRPTKGNKYQVVPVRQMCEQLKIRPPALARALSAVEALGLLDKYEWNSTYFVVSMKTPAAWEPYRYDV